MSAKKGNTPMEKVDGLEETTEQSAAVFEIAELRTHCMTLFGITQSAFDGATFGLKGKHTVEQVKATIKNWNEKEVR